MNPVQMIEAGYRLERSTVDTCTTGAVVFFIVAAWTFLLGSASGPASSYGWFIFSTAFTGVTGVLLHFRRGARRRLQEWKDIAADGIEDAQ